MRTILGFLALLAFTSVAQAQSPSFGLKAGLNVSTIQFDEELAGDGDFATVGKAPRLGFVGGLTADVPFTPMIGLRAEVLYSQKGFATTLDFDEGPDGEPFSGSQISTLDYLEVPLLARVSIPLQDGLTVGLLAGPTPAFLLSDGLSCGGDYNDFEEFESFCDGDLGDDDIDDESVFKSFDLGGALGVEVGAGPFSVGARYTRGFGAVIKDEYLDMDTEDEPFNNSVLSFTAAYRFGK